MVSVGCQAVFLRFQFIFQIRGAEDIFLLSLENYII